MLYGEARLTECPARLRAVLGCTACATRKRGAVEITVVVLVRYLRVLNCLRQGFGRASAEHFPALMLRIVPQ